MRRVLFVFVMQSLLLGGPAWATTSSEMQHGDWHSLLVSTPVGTFSRAVTVRLDESGDLYTFNIDSPDFDCDTVRFTINVNLNEMQYDEVESPVLFGKFRVDRNPVHELTYTASIEPGADFMTLTIQDWSRSDSILREIMSGDTARFKFKVGDDDYYFRFSLKGSRSAIQRQDRICRDLMEGDAPYFRDERREEDDEEFFL